MKRAKCGKFTTCPNISYSHHFFIFHKVPQSAELGKNLNKETTEPQGVQLDVNELDIHVVCYNVPRQFAQCQICLVRHVVRKRGIVGTVPRLYDDAVDEKRMMVIVSIQRQHTNAIFWSFNDTVCAYDSRIDHRPHTVIVRYICEQLDCVVGGLCR